MLQLTMVLFALQHFRSPTVAGAVVFLSVMPGLALSPIAGALLDRHGRARLIVVDFCIAATSIALIATLSLLDVLSVPALLAIVTLTSLTNPLSAAGMRSLFPLVVPSRLWPRANAIDANGYLVASVFGPAAAGAIYAFVGPEAALYAIAGTFVAAAVATTGVHDPTERRENGSLLREAWAGLRYVIANRTLRGLAFGVSAAGLASGIYLIALPVVLLDHVGIGPDGVGRLYALYGVGGFFAGLLFGRVSTLDRERRLLAIAYATDGAIVLIVLFVPHLFAIAAAMLLLGAVSGPTNVVMFTLRQRRTHPEWFGRAFAISMSLNYAGNPIGSVVAGTIIPFSVELALAAAAAFYLLAGTLCFIGIPAVDEAGHSRDRAGVA